MTTQFWNTVAIRGNEKNQPPAIFAKDDQTDYSKGVESITERQRIKDFIAKMQTGLPFFEASKEDWYNVTFLRNVSVSRCFECKEEAIWVYDRLIYPLSGDAPLPNADLPPEIKADYLEASSILNLSPRGAAALVRLCIQKLCKELGENGKNINEDIGELVKKGLSVKVQQALDAVRVIGNSAVHPGKIDLTDDRPTAETLFRLLNVIADKMISEPKHIDEIYASLPDTALAAIEKRDKVKE
ncbi:DUF4145 domain-containing protein [Rhizobium laguerreae]|uniref:DUF4145 domain-containing protein n=1 Tax=Rhizobium laguerreae TaxID=1076926 RepID=UPI001981BAE1|nr:DUF4145 domain-containing protein [Rhizobium laguerreae]